MINDKVSIIVPVYNAEKYLGYTITSILKQTYKNIEIILVNDGSKDDSLIICQNYAAIDDRIKVLDIPNGGVSNARNCGIESSTGKYIQFVDSDDVIAENMTERLVETMYVYEADMVICGMRYMALEGNRPVSSNDWLPQYLGKECVLSREKFVGDFSRILLYTVLLEGPCNKLYKREYFENYGFRFPLDKELGEDFLLNLQYFGKLERIVFISDVLYYYLQWGKNSLTTCYRSDMFDNQTLLLQEYEKFLRAQCVWKDENITYFYQYAVGHVIRCINMVFDSRNDSEDTGVKAELFRILNNDSVIRWIQNVAWIPEDYEWLKKCVKNTDIGLAYDKLVNISRQKNMLNNEIEAGQEVHNPGKVNQKLDQILRRINSILNSQKVAKVIGSLEDDGIKITISKVRKSCRYRGWKTIK
jgi:glycosyltransferase involved in cell wall biosynthesis